MRRSLRSLRLRRHIAHSIALFADPRHSSGQRTIHHAKTTIAAPFISPLAMTCDANPARENGREEGEREMRQFCPICFILKNPESNPVACVPELAKAVVASKRKHALRKLSDVPPNPDSEKFPYSKFHLSTPHQISGVKITRAHKYAATSSTTAPARIKCPKGSVNRRIVLTGSTK